MGLWNSLTKVLGGSVTATDSPQFALEEDEEDDEEESWDDDDGGCSSCAGIEGMQYCPECHRVDPSA